MLTFTSKRSRVLFPFRSPAGGAQPTLPACRAWRIIAASPEDFADQATADYQGVAAVVAAGEAPAAPLGCRDGAYPLWVRLTDEGGQPRPPLYVADNGWNLTATGPDWRIEFVGAHGYDADRFAYVVELVQDVAECGQVNDATRPPPAQRLLVKKDIPAGSPAQNIQFNVPPYIRRLLAWHVAVGGAQNLAMTWSMALVDPRSVNALWEVVSSIANVGSDHGIAIGEPYNTDQTNGYVVTTALPLARRMRLDLGATTLQTLISIYGFSR